MYGRRAGDGLRHTCRDHLLLRLLNLLLQRGYLGLGGAEPVLKLGLRTCLGLFLRRQ